MDVAGTLSRGEAFHKAGELERAEQEYRAALRTDPACAPAWFLLGAVCQATGRGEEAIASLREAIQIRPGHEPTWNLLGVALAGQGRPAEAESCFRRVLQLQPGHAEAARNLERARVQQAGTAVEKEDGSPREVVPSGSVGSFEACCRRAYALCEQERFAEAESWYHQALAYRPDAADVLNDLGKVLVLQLRAEEGAGYFRRAVAADPEHARAFLNLAAAMFELNRMDEAEAAARRAVEIEPENPSAHNNLGLIFLETGRPCEAEGSFREGLRLAPDHPDLHANLAQAMVMQGRAPEGQPHYERALELNPDASSAHSNWLFSRQVIPGVDVASLAEAHARWDRQHAAALRSTWRRFANDRDPDRPLRLGFVSAAFKRHAIGYLIIRAIEGLKGLDCETICYATHSGRDEWTRRFADASTVWRQARGLTDPELADQIRADRVDLLFDLAGHTSDNRLLVFARKPAPIQLTWLGYEGTTGLSAIDYLIADRYQVLEGTEASYRERIIRLPDGYVCYDPPPYAPPVAPLPAFAAGHVTFGCFNNPSKVAVDVVDVWAEILGRVPDSRLLLKYKGLDDAAVRRRFLGLVADRGIDPGRVNMEGWSPHQAMLASYGRVDVALDTFPYSGNTTTCEALWMGVPVVTFPRETFTSRHGLSHLSNVGLTETVACDRAGYVDIAAGLARDLPRLAELRAGLRSRMAGSPLCDGDRFARNLFESLRIAWRAWCLEPKGAEG
jgi:protein O-GlcNAc transferase